LRFSTGVVSSKEFPQKGFHELANMADLRMYEEKKKFYRSHKKMDRRLVSDTEGTE
ncbi:MAG: hypothetical protein HUJ58_07095, partial [Erysipelotrichaceae bacterium]|nr:hypothetical protein [Erysipelotrichaceae bacterium]